MRRNQETQMECYKVNGNYTDSNSTSVFADEEVDAGSEKEAIDKVLPAGAVWSSPPYAALIS